MHPMQQGLLADSTVTTQPGPHESPMTFQQLNNPSAPPLGGLPLQNMICPPGLEYLIHHELILMKRPVVASFSDFTSDSYVKRYTVTDKDEEQIYDVYEKSSMFSRCCYGAYRDFEVKVLDRNQREVITIVRPYEFKGCCNMCDDQEMHIFSNGIMLGKIVLSISMFNRKYTIKNERDEIVFVITGPSFRGLFTAPIFKVKSADEQHHVGSIFKRFVTTWFKQNETFEISFPADLDVKMKAMLIGACIFLDVMYYQVRH